MKIIIYYHIMHTLVCNLDKEEFSWFYPYYKNKYNYFKLIIAASNVDLIKDLSIRYNIYLHTC